MRSSLPLSLLGLLYTVAAGCAAEPAIDYDDTWGDGEIVTDGKADDLLDEAPPLALGESARGMVGGRQLDLYTLELRRGDRIELSMTVTSGNLDPHFSLFFGASTAVGSSSWDRDGAVLRKTYEIESNGVYALAVRAYRDRGMGSYGIAATCRSGPCAGDLPEPEPLDVDDAATCIGQARRCAFERMAEYDGAVGAVRARVMFGECLSSATLRSGASCGAACETTEAKEHCDAVIAAIPFYADRTPACLAELDVCIASCHDDSGAGDEADEFWETRESICFRTGLNGQCDSYARGHVACGGRAYGNDTLGECDELCESTTGAWIDDLDTLCIDACSCSDAREICDTDCADSRDADCFEHCAGETPCPM